MDRILNGIICPSSREKLSYKENIYISLVVEASLNLLITGCPSLEKNGILSSNVFYEEFIDWCYVNQRNTDWRLPLSFYEYLLHLQTPIENDTMNELIFLACSQWTYQDKSSNRTLLLCHTSLCNRVFGSNKSQNAESFREVFYYETDKLRPLIELDKNKPAFIYWILKDDNEYPTSPGKKHDS
ncbi:hypothetical protein [Aeromonas salmonicida]|uniref:hypothetical protein n=1 Tax=Aeromonas salmonicida TaxID=645 RepID=UPI003D087445